MMITCPVCGNATSILGIKENESVYQCNNCTLVFIDNDKLNIDKVDGEFAEERNTKNINVERLVRLKNPKTLLDFGCGSGKFIKFCKSQRIVAEGIDLDTKLQLDNLTKKYDAITLIEVVEHLHNPVEIFNIFRKHLKPYGIIYIEGSFTDTEKLYGNADFNILDWWYLKPSVGHITFFNQKSMETLATNSGLSLIESRFNANVFRLCRSKL